MMRRLIILLAVAAWAPVRAADPLPEMVPPELRRDMATVNGYFDAVRQRQGKAPAGAAAAPAEARPGQKAPAEAGRKAVAGSNQQAVAGSERDPFQVTPELRSRGERRQAAKSIAQFTPGGGGEPLPPMRVKAKALGQRSFAVLAVGESGKERDLVVRKGEPLQFEGHGRVYVLDIDRDGVLVGSGPDDQDKVLLK